MNWVVKIAQDSTWSWRKILKLREEAKPSLNLKWVEERKKKKKTFFAMIGGIQMVFYTKNVD